MSIVKWPQGMKKMCEVGVNVIDLETLKRTKIAEIEIMHLVDEIQWRNLAGYPCREIGFA